MSVRKHRDCRVKKREQQRARRRALHKHRSGFHDDAREKERQQWLVEQLRLPENHEE